jgi:hypothetical protein
MNATIQDLVNASNKMQEAENREEIEKAKDEFLELIGEIDVHKHMILAVDIVASLRIRDNDHFRSFVLALAQGMISEMYENSMMSDNDDEGEIVLPPDAVDL